MEGHRIDQAQIDKVVAAFADAPVNNPDGQSGVALHVDNGPGSVMDPRTGETWGIFSDQDEVPHADELGTGAHPTPYDWSEFDAIRDTKFAGVRRPVFRYVLAIHSGPEQVWAGLARGGDSDFVVAMHENCALGGTPIDLECPPNADYTSATFMHELGHNLGLHHGGTDRAAYKPNYLSVMNYSFGFGLRIVDASHEMDFSRFELPLDENALDEDNGFGVDEGQLTRFETIYYCADGQDERTTLLDTRPVDWNCDGTAAGTVSTDVDKDGDTTVLSATNDWIRLVYDQGGVGDLAEPFAAETTAVEEPSPEELRAAQDLLVRPGVSPIGAPAQPGSPPATPSAGGSPGAGAPFGALPRPIPALRRLVIAGGVIRVGRDGVVRVAVSNPNAVPVSGSLRLDTAAPRRRRARKAAARRVVLARRAFRVAAGRRAVVRLRLPRTYRRQLSRGRRLAVRATLTAGAQTVRRDLVLRPRAKR
jgi:hypothetical protein